jgi:hypothetical protein
VGVVAWLLQDPALSDVDSDAKVKPAKGKGKRKAPAKPKAKKGSAVGRYPALVACPGGGAGSTVASRQAKSTDFALCFPGHFMRLVSCPNLLADDSVLEEEPKVGGKGKAKGSSVSPGDALWAVVRQTLDPLDPRLLRVLSFPEAKVRTVALLTVSLVHGLTVPVKFV